MRIRLAVPADIPGMAELDRDPGGWSGEDVAGFVRALGTVKVAAEGPWAVGWVAYRKAGDLLVVERLAVADDPATECEVARRLLTHVERLGVKACGIDVALGDNRPALSKTLAALGYSSGLVQDFYGAGRDGIAFHKKRETVV